MGQIWDFLSLNFLFILSYRDKMNRKLILKSAIFVPVWAKLWHLCSQITYYITSRDIPRCCIHVTVSSRDQHDALLIVHAENRLLMNIAEIPDINLSILKTGYWEGD